MPATKKYKLFSANTVSESGTLPLCAFFATEAGCRNGEQCKFRHALPDQAAPSVTSNVSPSSSSLVSSESEGEMAVDIDVFAKPGDVPSKKAQPGTNSNKKKNKKKRKISDGDIFANPKKQNASPSQPYQKKHKTSAEKKRSVAVSPPPSSTVSTATPKTLKMHQRGQNSSVTPQNRSKPKTKMQDNNKNPPSFRNLNLPVAAFAPRSATDSKPVAATASTTDLRKEAKDAPEHPVHPAAALPLVPKSTPTARKWQKAVLKTRAHTRYDGSFDFAKYMNADESAGLGPGSDWIKPRPFGPWCADHPQAIAIDCEMCQTKDPVSGVLNPKALCRVSIVNAERPDEVLLDTLVKPAWPVVDYRTWVNGITEQDLEHVQFTLRHAQAYLMALCSDETIVLGHALHNDLVALKMEHHCNVDSAMLFPVRDGPDLTPSLKDLAKSVLQKQMPSHHDSVNDARTALLCLESYVESDGNVKPVVRTPNRSNSNSGSQLFVHRIPRVCQPSHLSSMFLSHTSIQPSEVGNVEYTGDSGKALVTFQSTRHANLAFDTLEGNEEPDKSGRMQKKVFLKNGDYVRVRKMLFPQNDNNKNK